MDDIDFLLASAVDSMRGNLEGPRIVQFWGIMPTTYYCESL